MTLGSMLTWYAVEQPVRLCETQVLASAEDFARGRCVALVENHGWGWITSALPPAADGGEGLIRSFLGNDVATAKAWCERTCRLHDRDPSTFTQPRFSPDLAKTSLGLPATDQVANLATCATEPSCRTGDTVECRQAGDDSVRGDPSTAILRQIGEVYAENPDRPSFANLANLLSLHEQIRSALDADPSRSDRDIARTVGCSPTTVGKARAAMGLSTVHRSVQRGGQAYAMRAPAAGAAS